MVGKKLLKLGPVELPVATFKPKLNATPPKTCCISRSSLIFQVLSGKGRKEKMLRLLQSSGKRNYPKNEARLFFKKIMNCEVVSTIGTKQPPDLKVKIFWGHLKAHIYKSLNSDPE